jgi:hypothetical protein
MEAVTIIVTPVKKLEVAVETVAIKMKPISWAVFAKHAGRSPKLALDAFTRELTLANLDVVFVTAPPFSSAAATSSISSAVVKVSLAKLGIIVAIGIGTSGSPPPRPAPGCRSFPSEHSPSLDCRIVPNADFASYIPAQGGCGGGLFVVFFFNSPLLNKTFLVFQVTGLS